MVRPAYKDIGWSIILFISKDMNKINWETRIKWIQLLNWVCGFSKGSSSRKAEYHLFLQDQG